MTSNPNASSDNSTPQGESNSNRGIWDNRVDRRTERLRYIWRMGISRDTNELKQVEGAWHRAALIENYDERIMSVTLDGIVVGWNKCAERVYGYTASEIIGRPASVLFPPDYEPQFPEILGRLRRGECIKNEETTRRRKDGSMVDTLATLFRSKIPRRRSWAYWPFVMTSRCANVWKQNSLKSAPMNAAGWGTIFMTGWDNI